MSNYDEIVLKQGSTVITYLAPNFKVEPVMKNNIINHPRARGRGPRVIELRRIILELVVQGTFLDSTSLPADHVTALETLFGETPGTLITAVRQVNRVMDYMWEGGEMQLKNGDDDWKASTSGTLDIAAGTYPAIYMAEARPGANAGVTKREYMLRFIPGFSA